MGYSRSMPRSLISGQRRMSRVEVTKGAVIVPSEDRDRRVLIPLAVFASEIVFERIGATTQEPQVVPASPARVRSQRHRIGRGNNGNIDILGQVMSDTIPAVDPSVHMGQGVACSFRT